MESDSSLSMSLQEETAVEAARAKATAKAAKKRARREKGGSVAAETDGAAPDAAAATAEQSPSASAADSRQGEAAVSDAAGPTVPAAGGAAVQPGSSVASGSGAASAGAAEPEDWMLCPITMVGSTLLLSAGSSVKRLCCGACKYRFDVAVVFPCVQCISCKALLHISHA